MTKRKLEKTKKIEFKYSPENKKNIIAIKDSNLIGKKYDEKRVYDLITTISLHYPHIYCIFDKESEKRIREYAKSVKKSEGHLNKLKRSKLEILSEK